MREVLFFVAVENFSNLEYVDGPNYQKAFWEHQCTPQTATSIPMS